MSWSFFAQGLFSPSLVEKPQDSLPDQVACTGPTLSLVWHQHAGQRQKGWMLLGSEGPPAPTPGCWLHILHSHHGSDFLRKFSHVRWNVISAPRVGPPGG